MPAPDEVVPEPGAALYAHDPVLSSRWPGAGVARRRDNATDDPSVKTRRTGAENGYGNLTPLFQGAGKLLAAPEGPRVAVLDVSGWDTHVNEGAADGQLGRRLAALDAAIDGLKTAMGPAVWAKTAVVMATEFGRTVHPNGNNGTDHGTGGAAFLFGGAVAGGKVRAEWVGLSTAALKDGRDQPARTDLRALFKGILTEQMGVPKGALETKVFPDSAAAAPLAGLIGA